MSSYVFGQLGVWGMFILFGAMQGLVLGGHFVLRRRGDPVANRWLGLVILLIAVHMGETMLTETALVEYVPWAMGSTWFLVFMLPPAYYFYVRRLTRPQLAFTWTDVIHFLPALVILVDMWPWLTVDVETKIAWQRHLANGGAMNLQPRTIVKLAFHIVQNFGYLVACYLLVQRTGSRLDALSADNDLAANLKSLRSVIWWFAAWTAVYLGLFFGLVFGGSYGAKVDKVWMILISVFVQANGLAALNRPEMFGSLLARELTSEPEGEAAAAGEPDPAEKYSKSALPNERLRDYRIAFERLMESGKPYRDGTLRLADLAERLGLSTHHLSQVLNRELGGTFCDVVNRYRVAEATRLMESPEHDNRTLLALALDAGFNNKNSFNRAFKKECGCTPSRYWRERQKAR